MAVKKCGTSILRKLSIVNGKDPCPRRGKGAFKHANICSKYKVVYYTPVKENRANDYLGDIANLKNISNFPSTMKKYFLTPICKLKKAPSGKSRHKTVLVEEMTPVDSGLEKGIFKENFIDKYINFFSKFFRDISSIPISQRWHYITCDFKPANMMLDKRGNLLFSDFTPAHKDSFNRISLTATTAFLLGGTFIEYNPLRPYSDIEISDLMTKVLVLQALITLFIIIASIQYKVEWYIALVDIYTPALERRLHTLPKCYDYVFQALRGLYAERYLDRIMKEWPLKKIN